MNTGTFEILGGDYASGGLASSGLKQQLRWLGTDAGVLRRAMIAAYEAEMNVVVHARRGVLRYALDAHRLDVVVLDEGPGIPDIAQAMQEGFSTASAEARALGFGAGMGLPNIRRNTDSLTVRSVVGQGTEVCFSLLLEPAPAASEAESSLGIVPERCTRCLRCLSVCPTAALRLRPAGPVLLAGLCVDCGACLAACRFGALVPLGGQPALPEAGTGPLAMPAALAGQLPGGPDCFVAGLDELGRGAPLWLDPWEHELADAVSRHAAALPDDEDPVISPACPGVLQLLALRFPTLLPLVAPFATPLVAAWPTLAARGASLVAVCSAGLTALRQAGAPAERLLLPAALLDPLRPVVRRLARRPRPAASPSPSPSPAPARALPPGDRLRVEGLSHVLAVLQALESRTLRGIRVIEPWLCDQGCLGSPLLPEDAFVAGHRLRGFAPPAEPGGVFVQPRPAALVARPGIRLDPDLAKAVAKLAWLDSLTRSLPGRDCAVCGAPSCSALAEDLVLGRIPALDCPYQAHAERTR
ncbi:MAG: 4Fe-4S binding protein [Myxococcota bacterium]|nr:4Fe-4S binding protein [Myxococcota bacterium]